MPATSSTLDAAISDLQAAADSCTYGLTNRRLKPLRTAMEQQPLCLDAYPAIMGMPVAKLGNDSKQKYMRVVLQLCESAADAAFDAILCAQVVRTASRPGSLDSTAKIASSVIRILANAQRGDDCELTEDETRRTNALVSLQRDALAKKQQDKKRAPLLAAWRERIASAPLYEGCDGAFVDLVLDDEHGELCHHAYGDLADWASVVLRTYLIPGRSNMFNKVIWGTEKGEAAEGCIDLRDDETILIQLGRPSGGNTKNGKEVSIDTRDERFQNMEALGLTDCKLVYKALKLLRDKCELMEGDAYLFAQTAECLSPRSPKAMGAFFTHVMGGDPALYRRSFEQAAQDALRDDGVAFDDDNDALVHELCQHSAVAAKTDYCASGDETALPTSLWLEENGSIDSGSEEHGGSEEDGQSPRRSRSRSRSRSPTLPLPSPSPSPVRSPRARRRSRSPTPEADRHPDYTHVLGAAMDAIVAGNAGEQDYARAASAAFLIPMHGQQDRLRGADLSLVQTAIDASRAAKRARTQ